MQQGIMDLAIDVMKERLNDAKVIVREQYKGTRPFRIEPPTGRESLYRYLSMTPEMKNFARQSFGEGYDIYEQKMEALKKKYDATDLSLTKSREVL